MKKTILAVFAMIAIASTTEAQVSMRFELNDGNYADFPVSTVKSVSWITGEDYNPGNAPAGAYAVDLGLPSGTKWANMNVGATFPEDYGDYFAWGETEPKDSYTWSTYKWCNGTSSSMTKYCAIDNKAILDQEDDAAYVNWGKDWRMPTSEEQKELIDNCKWTWTALNGVNGYMVTSKINGNSIFLPAAGYILSEKLRNAGTNGYCWSSSLRTSNSSYASSLSYSTTVGYSYNYRYYGNSVRAVYDTRVPVTSIEVSGNKKIMAIGEKQTLSVTVLPENAKDKSVTWSSSNQNVATVSELGEVTAKDEGSVTIIATAADGSDVKGTFEITVTNPSHMGHEYIDLGLPSGIKWATMNVGAASPEDYGDYFAWGETEPKDNYGWSNYKWCNGTDSTMTKYCTSSDYGTVDNKTVLDPEDDAAYVNWGGYWSMPSYDEQVELIDNCTWTWTALNGVNGYKVTGPNGKSIFLPGEGFLWDSDTDDVATASYYWSSSLGSNHDYLAYLAILQPDGCNRGMASRFIGLFVRAVYGRVVTSIEVSGDKKIMTIGEKQTLSAAVLPENANDKGIIWSSSNQNVATVSEQGEVAAVSEGFATITATATDGSGVKGSFEISVTTLSYMGHEYVDLGLPSGLKWATMNVGATTPEGYGDYFAWGETEPKENYSLDTYFDSNYEKYSKSQKTVLDPRDDAAHVNWRGIWRMPTNDEQKELIDNCTWTWTTQNGVIGYKVTSKSNGNFIFLPAAGYRAESSSKDTGSKGCYRSSSLMWSDFAYILYFNSSSVKGSSGHNRWVGEPVRAVCP